MRRYYPITPVPKPRQTRADKYLQRPPVLRYRAFADQCRAMGVQVNESGDRVLFVMPMPASWSKKKREQMLGEPHQQTPDIDNLIKALLDAVLKQDCAVWDIRASKLWGNDGEIQIEAAPF